MTPEMIDALTEGLVTLVLLELDRLYLGEAMHDAHEEIAAFLEERAALD